MITEGTTIDDTRNAPAVARNARIYWSDLEMSGVKVTYCNEGCVRSYRQDGCYDDEYRAANHQKMFLLEINGVRRVIQSSANDVWVDRYEQAISFDGDFYNNLWNEYWLRWLLMKNSWKDGGDFIGISYSTQIREVMAYLGPYNASQTGAGDDFYIEQFNRITPSSECYIGIAMGHWTHSPRGLDVVDKINRLHDGGCTVRAIFGGSTTESQGIVDRARFFIQHNDDVHAKFVLMRYRDAQGLRSLVYSGSHNFTHTSWAHDDEGVVRVDRIQIFRDFVTYMQFIDPNGPWSSVW